MKRIYRLLALLLALCLAAGLLTGCDEDPNDEEKLSVVMTGLFTTMDPAMAAAMDQGAMETMEHNYLEPVADAILAHEQG